MNMEVTHCEVLGTDKNEKDIDKLFDLYRSNPQHARVLFMSNKNRFRYSKTVLFKMGEWFDIVEFDVRHGISTTNKIFKHEKRLSTIRYRKNGFWFVKNRRISQLMFRDTLGGYGGATPTTEYLKKNFAWYRALDENHDLFMGWFTHSFNYILKHKLFSFKKLVKAHFKLPTPTCNTIVKMIRDKSNQDIEFFSRLHYYLPHLKNVENLSPKLLGDYTIFRDAVDMARQLGKTLNCSWGPKRLKVEHDKWAEEITLVLYEHDNRKLKIKDVFSKFAEWSGYNMIETTKDLALEGLKMHHCVGTYGSRIDSGESGVYRYKGYTLELRYTKIEKKEPKWKALGHIRGLITSNKKVTKTKSVLVMNQLRGIGNADAPQKLKDEVNAKIDKFNLVELPVWTEEKKKEANNEWDDIFGPSVIVNNDNLDDLPF